MRHVLLTNLIICLNIFIGCSTIVVEEKKPIYVSTSVGESVLFFCDLDFPHDVETSYILNWNKEGERIVAVQNGTTIYTREGYVGRIHATVKDRKAKLNFTSVREPDHGWYECRLFFPNRTPTTRLNGTWFHLTVHGSDLLRTPPMNQTVFEGESVTLECASKDESARVVWYKDGLALGPIGVGQRRKVSPTGSLTISQAHPDDLGMYKCEVISEPGQTQSASAYLNVKYKARVVYTPKQVFLPFGKKGQLECQNSANPPTTKVRWEKDGFLFDPLNVPGVVRRNGTLYFSKVDESHGGEYTCTPTNEIGSAGPSPPIHVIVQHPPVFTMTPHNMYLRKPGDSIHMICDALDGETRPKIVWFKKDGNPLPDRAKQSGGNLTISDIKESDRGMYQCVASNDAATISVDTELLIENSIPRGPHNLTGEAGQNYVTLSWHPGIMASSAQYSVAVRVVDSQDWRTIRVSGNKATISSLDSDTEYEFMILSQDHNGDGTFSKPIRLVTKGSKSDQTQASTPIAIQGPLNGSQKIGPPKRLRIYSGVYGYVLEWNRPEYGAEFLDKYQVFKMEETSDFTGEESLVLVQDTTDTSYLVGDLEENSVHHFQVKSLSTDGTEALSERYVLHVPSYQKAESFTLFLAVLTGFVTAMIIMCIYTNRMYVRSQIEMLKGPRR
ncbi:hypothetical protein O3M35_007251 [Rhynocoris fuscipes]|uniref:Protein turtle n=1 Tax=Rhynocoris fuscipes TaxID=488301 RepID=A0AAW1DE04_9HEMI